MNPKSRDGLSWIELLMLLAVLGILAAVLAPTLGRMKCGGGHRTIDASNIRQLGQAAWIYANDHRGQLPGLSLNQEGEIEEGTYTPNIHAVAAALARYGGVNDPDLWISRWDNHPDAKHTNGPILRGQERTLCPDFVQTALSFQFIAGLNTAMSSTTPVVFTRGLDSEGGWVTDKKVSVYGDEGGHIVFLGGNVRFYRNLHQDGGQLRTGRDEPTANILETIDSTQRIFSYPATPTGAVGGTPGIGERGSKTK